MPFIRSINVALPELVAYAPGKEIHSAIRKQPVTGRIFLDTLGFSGDGSADKYHHGGPDKAVCVYCADHYPFWEKELSRKISCGAFGENLTVAELNESNMHIGDVFQIGEAKLQCTQPRQPCRKLMKIFDWKEMIARVKNTGFTGFYCRVLKSGWVHPKDSIELLKSDSAGFSVEQANRLRYEDRRNYDRMKELLAVEALSEEWREYFQDLLIKHTGEDTSSLLDGS